MSYSTFVAELEADLDALGMTRMDSDHSLSYDAIAPNATRYQIRATLVEKKSTSASTVADVVRVNVTVVHRLGAGVQVIDSQWAESIISGGLQFIVGSFVDPSWWRDMVSVFDLYAQGAPQKAMMPRLTRGPERIGKDMLAELTATVELA